MLKYIKKKKTKEIISALDSFIQQIYWGEDLELNEAKRNLEEGVVEIIKYGKHTSNGLLITDDGYFLTALHCVDDTPKLNIKLHNGKTYKLEKEYIYAPKLDIALAKANISCECKLRRYKFFNTNRLEKMPVALLTRWEGKLIIKGGFTDGYYGDMEVVKRPDNKIVSVSDQFTSNISSRKGDSGGIVVSSFDARLMGILSSTNKHTSSATGWLKILELIDFYKRKLLD
jgi:hypothetical protein